MQEQPLPPADEPVLQPCSACGGVPEFASDLVPGHGGHDIGVYAACACGMRTRTVWFYREGNEADCKREVARIWALGRQPPAPQQAVEPDVGGLVELAAQILTQPGVGFSIFAWKRGGEYAHHTTAQELNVEVSLLQNILRDLQRKHAIKGPQIILPSGAGHPRRIPR